MKVITGSEKGDIISQYILFTKVVNEQIREHGRTRDAITEAIRICKNQDVLKEYLSGREKEVVDIIAKSLGRSVRSVEKWLGQSV